MRIQFVRMIQFTRLVKANGRLREFNFRKVKSPDEELFDVNVCNDRGERIIFSMQKKGDAWRIIPCQIPQWILQNETSLDKNIKDELVNW
jgi:hypothetical protein